MADYNQAWDYALDLKNFHLASHDAPIWPVLVATEAVYSDDAWAPTHPDGVRPPRRCSAGDIRQVFDDGLRLSTSSSAVDVTRRFFAPASLQGRCWMRMRGVVTVRWGPIRRPAAQRSPFPGQEFTSPIANATW
jgi:hypothetical protein